MLTIRTYENDDERLKSITKKTPIKERKVKPEATIDKTDIKIPAILHKNNQKQQIKEYDEMTIKEFSKPIQFLIKTDTLVMGVGGASIDYVGKLDKEQINSIVIDTDIEALKKINGLNRCLIGGDILKGQGTDANTEVAARLIMEEKEKIESILKNTKKLILVCGLGGGTGGGMSPVIAEIAQKLGIKVCVIGIIPFTFETKIRKNNATNTLKSLEEKLVMCRVYEADRYIDMVDRKATILDILSLLRKDILNDIMFLTN